MKELNHNGAARQSMTGGYASKPVKDHEKLPRRHADFRHSVKQGARNS